MSIKKNLMVSINEDVVSGDSDAIIMKTTNKGNIVVEMSIPKVAVKLEDILEAAQVLEKFIINNKAETFEISPNDNPTLQMEFGEEDSLDNQS